MKQFFSGIHEKIQSHPLATASGAFLFCTAFLLFLSSFVKIALLVIFTPILVFLIIARKKLLKHAAFLSLGILLTVSFMLSLLSSFIGYNLFDEPVSEMAKNEEAVSICCYPKERIYSSPLGNMYVMEVTEINGDSVFDVEVLCRFSPEDTPDLFRFYEGDCTFLSIQNENAGFDTANYYRSKGIFAQISEERSLMPTEKYTSSPNKLIYRIRSFFKNIITDMDPSGKQSFALALFLADRSGLPDTTLRDFNTLGISHLLAVSGLHLSVLISIFSYFLIKLKVPLKVRTAILILIAVAFMTICSFSVTVVRAGIMLILYLVARLVDEKSDSVTSLMFAGGVICLFSPYSILDCGFLLSFFASLGILCLNSGKLFVGKHTKGWKKGGQYLLSAIATTLAAEVMILPILCYYFGYFSPLAPFFNLIFTPLVFLVMLLTPIAILSSFLPLFGDFLFTCINGIEQIITKLSSFARCFKEFLITIDKSVMVPIVVTVAVCLLLFLLCRRKAICTLGILAVYTMFSTVFAALPYFDHARIYISEYKNNDVFLLYEENRSCIIDISNGSKNSFSYAMAQMKDQTGRQQPDTIVLTHYHIMHINTLRSVAEKYYVEELYLPVPEGESEKEIALSLKDLAESYGIAVKMYQRNDGKIAFGSFVLENFRRDTLKRSTHPVLSFSVQTESEPVYYFSSSANEIWQMPDSGILYFGEHGPIAKKNLDVSAIPDDLKLYFATQELYDIYGAPEGTVLEEDRLLVLYPNQ